MTHEKTTARLALATIVEKGRELVARVENLEGELAEFHGTAVPGPAGTLSADLHACQDVGPMPSGEPTNKEFFAWSQRAKKLEDDLAEKKRVLNNAEVELMTLADAVAGEHLCKDAKTPGEEQCYDCDQEDICNAWYKAHVFAHVLMDMRKAREEAAAVSPARG